MDDGHPEILIIKRINNQEEEHHGGAWKIAFADFMTAMMAFFLVLWIINATDKNTKTIIARYFNPVKLEDPAKTKKGVMADSGNDAAAVAADGKGGGTSAKAKTGAKGGASKAKPSEIARDEAGGPKTADGAAHAVAASSSKTSPIDPAKPRPTMSEASLFADPMKSLDKIARAPVASPGERITDAPRAATQKLHDPFKPIILGDPSPLDDAKKAKTSAVGDGRRLAHMQGGEGATKTNALRRSAMSGPLPEAKTASTAAKARSEPDRPPKVDLGPAKGPAGAKRTAQAQLVKEAQQIARELSKDLVASEPGPAIEIRASDDGLLISITDKMNYAMFAVGSAEPQRRTIHVISDIARALRSRPGELIVRGYTDGRPFKSTNYDNWRLSEARAQMAYYMLVRAGVPQRRFARIEGYADRNLKNPKDPDAAENRRVEILLRPPR